MTTIDQIVAISLSTIDQDARPEALRGWEWLSSEAEKVMGERPAPDDERVSHWLTRLQQEGMSAFGLHADVALAFFASVGHTHAVQSILSNAMDESQPKNQQWVGDGADQLANDALRLCARGCTDARALDMLLQVQALGLPLNLPGANGETPLHAASAAGRPELVSALLACGADPTQPDAVGHTPLHHLASIAVWRDRIGGLGNRGRIIKELLLAGARLEQTDNQGVSAEQALCAAGWSPEALDQARSACALRPRVHVGLSMRRH